MNRLSAYLNDWYELRFSDAQVSLMILAVAVIGVFLYKIAFKSFQFIAYSDILIFYVGNFILAFLLFRITYREQRKLKILLRSIVLILGSYAVLAYPSYEQNYYHILLFSAIASAILAWWRPAFVLPLATFICISKAIGARELGLDKLSETDFMPVLEAGLFLAIGYLFFDKSKRKPVNFEFSIIVITVAIHFGNYFYSGFEKINIGLAEWVLHNNTQNLIEITRETGHLPIAASDHLYDIVYLTFKNVFVLSNLTIFLAQILSVVFITRVRWAIWVTLFYDLTHIVIFFVTGIFFWKWILLNLAIVFTLSKYKSEILEPWLKLTSIMFIVLGGAVFFSARLGWFDTNAFVNHYFVAVDEAGVEYEVPTNYFLFASVTAAQNRFGTFGQHYPVATWGSTKNKEIKRQAEAGCSFLGNRENIYPGNAKDLQTFVKNHHQYIVNHVDENGYINYDLYPHHIWSNPFLYREFKLLDKRKIVRYIYINESTCLKPRFINERTIVIIDSL